MLATKHTRIRKTTAAPLIGPDHGQHKSPKHAFLDDTRFGDNLSLHQFINPQATKLYNDVRVSAFAFHNLL